MSELRHIADRCRADFEAARLPELPSGLIHGDLQGKNGVIADDGSLTLLDFDECGSGWLIDDLSVYLMCSLAREEPVETRSAFLDGYQEIRVLTAGEIAAVPSFVVARVIWAMGWQLRLHESSGRAQWLGDAYLDWNLNFLHNLGDTPTLHLTSHTWLRSN